MPDKDILALDRYQLLARVLHDVHMVSTQSIILDQSLNAPIIPLIDSSPSKLELNSLSLVDATILLAQKEESITQAIALVKTGKMGEIMPIVRKLSARNVAAIALDFTPLALTLPYGSNSWRPKTKEDLAELRAAAGCPVWAYGIASPQDAIVAMEASLEAIVVHSGVAQHLQGPATIDIFPEVFDSVAGMIDIYAGGPIRHGIDIFRYLAVGADAVIVHTDRPLANLNAELEYAMRLTACETLSDINYEAIFAPLFEEG